MDPSFLETLPEAHPIDTDVVFREFFAAVATATSVVDVVIAAGVASNQLAGLEA